jgi:hypothetical protein
MAVDSSETLITSSIDFPEVVHAIEILAANIDSVEARSTLDIGLRRELLKSDAAQWEHGNSDLIMTPTTRENLAKIFEVAEFPVPLLIEGVTYICTANHVRWYWSRQVSDNFDCCLPARKRAYSLQHVLSSYDRQLSREGCFETVSRRYRDAVLHTALHLCLLYRLLVAA